MVIRMEPDLVADEIHVSRVMRRKLHFGPQAGLLFCKLPCQDRLGSQLLQLGDLAFSA